MDSVMESIEKYKKSQDTYFEFDVLSNGDILFKSGKYKDMKLSDIFIFDSYFVRQLSEHKAVDPAIKESAKNIIEDNKIWH